MDVAEVPALGTNLVALGSLGPSAPSATPNSASAAHLGPAWPILRHAAILRESSQRWSPGKRQKSRFQSAVAAARCRPRAGPPALVAVPEQVSERRVGHE